MSLSAEQRSNADTIIAVGKKLGASTRDQIVAIMAALQESSLRNLSGGDRDSVGLFQQRNAWGTFAQRHDPAQAAAMFYQGGHAGQRGLFDVKNRDSMTLTQEAQAVEVSAYPNAYARWQGQATQIVSGSSGSSILDKLNHLGSAITNPGGAIASAVTPKAAGAVGGIAGSIAGAAGDAVSGAMGDIGTQVMHGSMFVVAIAAGAGLVLLGLNRATGGAAGRAAGTAITTAPLLMA